MKFLMALSLLVSASSFGADFSFTCSFSDNGLPTSSSPSVTQICKDFGDGCSGTINTPIGTNGYFAVLDLFANGRTTRSSLSLTLLDAHSDFAGRGMVDMNAGSKTNVTKLLSQPNGVNIRAFTPIQGGGINEFIATCKMKP
jgi:hypothetical protein